MSDEFISLSSTEDDLAADKDGEIRKSLVEQLQNEIARLKSPVNKDLTPKAFAQKESLIAAMEASIKMVEIVWAKYHLSNRELH